MLKKQLSFIILVAVFGLLGGALSSYLLVNNQAQAQTQGQSVLQAQQFILTDSRGKVRANISPVGRNNEYTEFSLYDNYNKIRMTLVVYSDERNPEILFFDNRGRPTKAQQDQMPWKQVAVTQQPVRGTSVTDSVSKIERKQLRKGKPDALGVTQADLDVFATQLELIMDKLDELAAYH